MLEIIQIAWTTGSIDEARKISRTLILERLIASAEIIPWIEKITLLNGQLETIQESKVYFMAVLDNFEAVQKIIIDNSSYQIPEITYHSFNYVEKNYSGWISHERA